MKSLGPGARIADRYVLETVIARGGMGAVFRAIDERLGRTVAIKILLEELAEDQTSLARFEREASASARLTHPAVVQVFDFGKHEGVSYIVMEHVVGRTLAAELDREKRIDPLRACDLIEQALGGIGAAHAAGIVHRDLKPGNIMLIPTGTGREVVKVLDFGIAQLKESKPYARLTKSGAVLGTPTFMSPEQARGETCDPRTDVYAMGVVLWCCLTGQRPFVAPDVSATLGKVLAEMPPRADKIDPSIPAAIAHATERAMEKRPNARFPTAAAFAEALMDAREASAIPATAAVSLPPERRDQTPAPMTREVPIASTALGAGAAPDHPGAVTRVGVSAAPAPAPAPVDATRTGGRSAWRRWALVIVGVALLVGVVIGGLLVVGVIECGMAGIDLRDLPAPQLPTGLPTGLPALPTEGPAAPGGAPPPQPAPPRIAPQQGGDFADPTCAQLHDCCAAFRQQIRPDFPDCDQFVRQLANDPALCADRIVMFEQMSAQRVPVECQPR